MEEVKLSLFADDMILYLIDPKESTKKFLGLINTFNTIAGYKAKVHKSIAFCKPTMNRLRKKSEK
jgi:hypothetical protein